VVRYLSIENEKEERNLITFKTRVARQKTSKILKILRKQVER